MDPVTLALIASGAQAVAGLGKTAFGASQQARGRKALDAAFEAPTGKPSEYADMLRQARASEVAQRRIDEINRSMATSTDALQQAGARGVIGGIGAVTQAGARAKTDALSRQQAEIMRALERSTIGAERQRSRDINRQIREENLAQQAIEAGIQNVAGGLGDIGQAGMTAVGALGKKSPGLSPAEQMSKIDKQAAAVEAEEMYTSDPDLLDMDVVATDSLLPEQLSDPRVQAMLKRAGMGIYEKGGVQKTPGAFSHKKNPINIMKDGAKIGEMTGGEYIFNPTQAKKMQKLAKSGNTDLHKFVKSLLNKPQFK